MKKRILSLVLCAVMLLSMCLFMGAGVTQDAAEAAGKNCRSAKVPRFFLLAGKVPCASISLTWELSRKRISPW